MTRKRRLSSVSRYSGRVARPARRNSGNTRSDSVVVRISVEGRSFTMDTDELHKVLDTEGDVAADYLEELLEIADLDGDIDIFTEGDRPHVSIVTDSDLLVGRDGAVLSALQELARLAVMTETGKRSRLMLDVAGFREKRRTELQALATEAIVEVRETGEPARLGAMNAFERKVVHDVVAASELISESEGQEPNRRVVISKAD
ncbi:MAG: single-stranded DNA-binding protein [Propionibacterium sp.]|nr:single-stranded DNA-binding protein [Propionibacterium sp.]